jgi:protein-S-isoprenylcysteine O-methyltransferase Ste14
MANRSTDSPDVFACPPLIFLAAIVIGLVLNRLIPIQPFPATPSRVTGTSLCIASGLVGVWGAVTMRRAGTNVRPDRPVTVLVTGGPFRFSRNPLYVSLTVLYLGITMLLNAFWPFATLVPALAFVRWKIVLREERFLETKFGDEYRAYKARVRRWL